MKNLNFKKLLPYLAAVAIFLVITMIFYYPLLEGKKMIQSDIMTFQGASKEVVDFREKTGQEALWTNSMFSGMPAYQISARYTGNLVGFFDTIFTLGLPHPANLMFLYFIGFFILLVVLGLDTWLAIAGSIAFAFSTFFLIIIDAGHNTQAHALGYVAPLIAGIILTLRRKYLLGGSLTALFLSLELKMNHPQITYYFFFLMLFIGLAELIEAIRKKYLGSFMKALGVLGIAGMIAVLTNITNLWTTYEYSKVTIRGKTELTTDKENRTTGLDKDYATQWSYGRGETMTLLVPGFNGGSTNEKLSPNSEVVKALRQNNVPEETIQEFIKNPFQFYYWGQLPFTSGPVYAGAIIVFLFFLGLLVVKGPLKWGLLAATILSILLAWGHNFMALTDFFFSYVPLYNKFRTVTMILVVAEFAMPLLGILALKEIFSNPPDKKAMFKKIQIALGIVGGLCLIFVAVPSMFLDFNGLNDAQLAKQAAWMMDAIRSDRESMVRMDALRSLIFIVLTAGLLWAVLFEKLKKEYAYIILIGLMLIDLFPVNRRYSNTDSFTTKSRVDNPFSPSPADEQILQDKDPDYRVLNVTVNPFTDASTSYFHKSIGGYHGAKLRRYQELYDHQIRNNNMAVLDMLNTKYLIMEDANKQPVAQRNPGALGNAWFVKGVEIVDNADQEIAAMDHFNPADTAIVDKRFQEELKGYSGGRDSSAFIKLDEYRPNYLAYSYKTSSPGLAVFSEIYYKDGWNAYVDGTLTPHLRANYVLRAMVLPAGDHKVVFKFEPRAYYVGEKVSLASSILLLLLLVLSGYLWIRKEMQPKA
jgi:hypothetical protein